MRILTVLEQNTWADYHLAGSLEHMGHLVCRFFYGNSAGEFYGRRRMAERAEKNAQLLALASELARDGLDLIFCYVYDDFLLPETAKQLAHLDIPMVNLNVDMVNQWYRQSRTAMYFTRMLCAHKNNMDGLVRCGGKPFYFPMAGREPDTSTGRFNPASDVTFVGTPALYRKKVLSHLAVAGIPLAIYGKYWNENRVATPDRNFEKTLSDLWHYGGHRIRSEGLGSLMRVLKNRFARNSLESVTAEIPGSLVHGFVPDCSMAAIFHNSKINIGLTRMIGEDPFSPGVCQVKLRDFEVPLAGGFYLVERADDYELHFEPGKEVVTWDDPGDLLEKVHYYLEHDHERTQIAAAGHRRALRDHTWSVRFAELFRHLGISDGVSHKLSELVGDCES